MLPVSCKSLTSFLRSQARKHGCSASLLPRPPANDLLLTRRNTRHVTEEDAAHVHAIVSLRVGLLPLGKAFWAKTCDSSSGSPERLYSSLLYGQGSFSWATLLEHGRASHLGPLLSRSWPFGHNCRISSSFGNSSSFCISFYALYQTVSLLIPPSRGLFQK